MVNKRKKKFVKTSILHVKIGKTVRQGSDSKSCNRQVFFIYSFLCFPDAVLADMTMQTGPRWIDT